MPSYNLNVYKCRPFFKIHIIHHSWCIFSASGTTDTYFMSAMAQLFKSEYKKLTGKNYDTNGMSMTDDEVDNVPSIIIQLVGNDEVKFDVSDPNKYPGLAGNLDPDNPNDILIVLTPNHYFEYDSDKDLYYPR